MDEELVKLDLKDKKILLELDMDARQTYSEIAKKVKMSKQGVEYKINNLIKKKVISKSYPIIHMTKLGYKYCRLVFKFHNLTSEKEKEIIEFIKNHKKIGWALKIEGSYDLGMGIWAKTITEFKDVINEFVYRFGHYIAKRIESIGTKVYHYQTRYLLNKTETREITIKEDVEPEKIDELDQGILKILCKNARTPLIEIAQQLNTSSKVVSYHIKNLEKRKIIEGYRLILNHSLLGYTYYKVLLDLSDLTKEKFIAIKNYLKYQPNVLYLIEAIGWKDLDFEMLAESNQEFFSFMKELRLKFPVLVKDHEILILTDTIKVSYLPEI